MPAAERCIIPVLIWFESEMAKITEGDVRRMHAARRAKWYRRLGIKPPPLPRRPKLRSSHTCLMGRGA